MAIKRSASISLLLSVLIVLLSAGFLQGQTQSPPKQFVDRQFQLDLNPTLNVSTDHARTVALLFGQQEHVVNFTSRPDLAKRAPFNFEYAKCKGESLWRMVQDAFNGQRQAGPDFTQNDFDNGWTKTAITGGLGGLPVGWDPAFQTFANNRVPTSTELHHLRALQDKSFKNRNGNTVQSPSRGEYQLYYAPSHKAMLARNVESPTYRRKSQGYPPAAIQDAIPPLHRLSDVSWYTYSRLSNSPGDLRYIGHHFISNDDSNLIIDQLLRNTPNIGWPGLTLDINTNEAKALLGTPNGVGVAWLMMDRARVLGRRRPKVHIWNKNSFRCMLWDLAPA
ncbi:MAG: hypothetical protein Q9183_002344 [Haloplaca sp. 2 TL-2023]